ncbi:MAG TPA: AmmeMemoRadiSam system protein B, partial [Tepidisphaeraceae bacterium]|nr:AmmeMemoRadiSam system protein B [Tepidisphaeraceae bacterium]
PLRTAALDSFDAWEEPSGCVEVAADVRRELNLRSHDLFEVDDSFHRREHAIEVELPLIRAAWPGAKVLPVEVPAEAFAADVGTATARAIADAGQVGVFLASSDLTHYGPAYAFTPAGVGRAGLAWAKQNDERVLRLVTEMHADAVVPEVQANANACGGGAIAAVIAACAELGATRAAVLRHASSYETLAAVAPQPPTNAVGYAAAVFG